MKKNTFLAIEFFLLCFALPTVIITFRLAPFMFFFLWGAGAICWFIFRRYHFKDVKKLWGWDAVTWENLRPVLIRWVICSILMLGFTWLYDAEKLFYIPKNKPEIIPFLMVGYPLLSALPQEFIFCTFFFDRYAPFFKTDRMRIFASAITFAYAHMLFINPVAPPISFIGGYIFASTFAKHRSLALVTIEHGLYGNVLFLVGLGWYFWGGAVAQAHY